MQGILQNRGPKPSSLKWFVLKMAPKGSDRVEKSGRSVRSPPSAAALRTTQPHRGNRIHNPRHSLVSAFESAAPLLNGRLRWEKTTPPNLSVPAPTSTRNSLNCPPPSLNNREVPSYRAVSQNMGEAGGGGRVTPPRG